MRSECAATVHSNQIISWSPCRTCGAARGAATHRRTFHKVAESAETRAAVRGPPQPEQPEVLRSTQDGGRVRVRSHLGVLRCQQPRSRADPESLHGRRVGVGHER
eukprot:7381407-Prymnesium_polylepis.2